MLCSVSSGVLGGMAELAFGQSATLEGASDCGVWAQAVDVELA